LVFQVALKGIRFRVIVLAWATATACVIAALALVNGWTQLWTVVYAALFLYISCEVGRLS
jgi:hypothetical protein